MGGQANTTGEHWSADKRVPVALIVAMTVQGVGIVWWAATMSAQSDQLERRVVVLERTVSQLPERLTRLEVVIETNLGQIKDQIRDLDRESRGRDRGRQPRE